MSNRPMPKVGQVYRHYKGSHYKVIRVCSSYPNDLEEGQDFEYYLSEGYVAFTAANSILRGSAVVFYRSLDGRTWARPLESFLEVLSSGTGGNASNWHRFELIQESAT